MWKWAIFWQHKQVIRRMESMERYNFSTDATRHLDWLIRNGKLNLPEGAKVTERFVYRV